MIGLTLQQKAAFDFIKSNIARNGVPPTFRDIAGHIGVKSMGHVHAILTCLEDRGAIRRIKGKARAIEIIDQLHTCPHCGGRLR